jgi:hypothetical protein
MASTDVTWALRDAHVTRLKDGRLRSSAYQSKHVQRPRGAVRRGTVSSLACATGTPNLVESPVCNKRDYKSDGGTESSTD